MQVIPNISTKDLHQSPGELRFISPFVLRKSAVPALYSLHLVSCKTGFGLPLLFKQLQELMTYRRVWNLFEATKDGLLKEADVRA